MRAHDYRYLMFRWRALARQAGVRLLPFAELHGERLYFIETPACSGEQPAYVSAGVHGDEAGATEGLLAWAELNAARLARLPLLLFPCLNPWGLRNNQRSDADGVDINRSFDTDHPAVQGVKSLVGTRRFRISWHLHEDYDATGVYLYELSRRNPWGEEILKATSRHLPTDMRRKIDISRATDGIVRRRVTRRLFQNIGYPEAIWLYFEHTDYAFTIETPSETALERRVAAHVAALEMMRRKMLVRA